MASFSPNEATRIVNSLERIEELLTILVSQQAGGVNNAETVTETVVMQREHAVPIPSPHHAPPGYYNH